MLLHVLGPRVNKIYYYYPHNEGCIETVMLRGDIYSVSGFYHITNGNHHKLKGDVIS